MSPRAKPATVRYYVDADMLGTARILATLRPDVTFPGDPGGTVKGRLRPASLITSTATKDPVWIRTVTEQGLMIITRDRHIQSRPGEIAAVRDAGARMVALSADDAGSTWAQLETLFGNWRKIEALVDQSGPFIYTCTRTSLRQVEI